MGTVKKNQTMEQMANEYFTQYRSAEARFRKAFRFTPVDPDLNFFETLDGDKKAKSRVFFSNSRVNKSLSLALLFMELTKLHRR